MKEIFNEDVDIVALATMKIVCTEKNSANPRTFTVESDSSGSTVTMNGKVKKAEQLIGGTEGGDPYMQLAGVDGYGIDLFGGALKEAVYAFGEEKEIKGKCDARVAAYDDNSKIKDVYAAECDGSFLFQSTF